MSSNPNLGSVTKAFSPLIKIAEEEEKDTTAQYSDKV
jgi:hypothetical protein